MSDGQSEAQKRIDTSGRDVMDLSGLWDESDKLKKSDELRAEAEEVVRYCSDRELEGVPLGYLWCASKLLARHYLATHRADDGELADSEWWLTFCNNKTGELKIHNGREYLIVELIGAKDRVALSVMDPDYDQVLLAANPTRGQVRKIVEALGGR